MAEDHGPTTLDEIQDEDVRLRAMNERRTEWWMANLNYLPIHHFRQDINKLCYELSTFPTAKRLTEIIREVEATMTHTVEQEIRQEHELYYGKDVVDWKKYEGRQVMGGYLSGYTLYLSKLLSIHVRGRKDVDRVALWTAIESVYTKCYGRPGDWYDKDVQRLHAVMRCLRRRRDGASRTSE